MDNRKITIGGYSPFKYSHEYSGTFTKELMFISKHITRYDMPIYVSGLEIILHTDDAITITFYSGGGSGSKTVYVYTDLDTIDEEFINRCYAPYKALMEF